MNRMLRICTSKKGDVTITWTPDEDEKMAAMIQKKMDQGVRFWMVEPFGDNAPRTYIWNIGDIKGREVNLADADIAILFAEGRVGIVGRIRQGINIIGRALDPHQAARSSTVVLNQPVGG